LPQRAPLFVHLSFSSLLKRLRIRATDRDAYRPP
jgi:hypothetical protein